MKISNKGFTLAETLISVGLIGGIALMSFQIQTQVNETTSSMEAAMDLNKFTAQVSRVLSDSTTCSQNFESLGLNLSGGASADVPSITNFSIPNNPVVLMQVFSGDPNTIRTDIGIPQKPFSRLYYLSQMTVTRVGVSNRTVLSMTYNKMNDKLPGLNQLKRNINIFGSYDASGVLQECHADLTAAMEQAITETCNEITNENPNASGNCEIHTYQQGLCGAGQYLKGFTLDDATNVYMLDCANLNLSTGASTNFASVYDMSGTGSITQTALTSGELFPAFGGGIPCPDNWDSTPSIPAAGQRHHNIFFTLGISGTLDVNCQSN